MLIKQKLFKPINIGRPDITSFLEFPQNANTGMLISLPPPPPPTSPSFVHNLCYYKSIFIDFEN